MAAGVDKKQQQLLKAIMAIQKDASLTEDEKAKMRQDLLAGKWSCKDNDATKTGTDTVFHFLKCTITYLNANADLGMQGRGHDEARVKVLQHKDKEKG